MIDVSSAHRVDVSRRSDHRRPPNIEVSRSSLDPIKVRLRTMAASPIRWREAYTTPRVTLGATSTNGEEMDTGEG